eukprot:10257681-Alexandrium_andersonii.AAC.1
MFRAEADAGAEADCVPRCRTNLHTFNLLSKLSKFSNVNKLTTLGPRAQKLRRPLREDPSELRAKRC